MKLSALGVIEQVGAEMKLSATAMAPRRRGGEGRQRAVIVFGDLNDTPEAATTQLLSGPPGSEIGTPGYDHPDQGDGQRLWNLAARRLPPEQRYSRIYHGDKELIDHILGNHLVTHHVSDIDIWLRDLSSRP